MKTRPLCFLKAREKLGWEAVVSFDELVKLMIEEDLKEARKDHLCNNAGFPVYNHSEYYFRPTNPSNLRTSLRT